MDLARHQKIIRNVCACRFRSQSRLSSSVSSAVGYFKMASQAHRGMHSVAGIWLLLPETRTVVVGAVLFLPGCSQLFERDVREKDAA